MKSLIHAFVMCQSMFCAIPFPCRVWDEKARNKMLLFLPLIGLEIGALWLLLAWLCRILEIAKPVSALLLCILPYILSGFIHLDGFMDVTDACRSMRSFEKRREILKDSHVGSFAVIGVVIVMLAQFAFFAAAPDDAKILILLFIPAVSRCCSVIAIKCIRPISESQYAKLKKIPLHIAVILAAFVVFLALGFIFCGKYGFAPLACAAVCWFAIWKGVRSLGGMNGDISGYAITLGELCGVIVYAMV